jgi:hypothetical protein
MRSSNYARWDGLMFEKHLKLCPDEFKSLAIRRIYESYGIAALGYFHHNDFLEARRLCMKSLQYKRIQPRIWLYLLSSVLPERFIKFIKRAKCVMRPIKQKDLQ